MSNSCVICQSNDCPHIRQDAVNREAALKVSSLREDVESMIRLAYHRGSGGMVSEVTTVSECTHNIMAFIDSHIPEKRVDNYATGNVWQEETVGFNEAVDLMREEIK